MGKGSKLEYLHSILSAVVTVLQLHPILCTSKARYRNEY